LLNSISGTGKKFSRIAKQRSTGVAGINGCLSLNNVGFVLDRIAFRLPLITSSGGKGMIRTDRTRYVFYRALLFLGAITDSVRRRFRRR
jgi:hypothetical protein